MSDKKWEEPKLVVMGRGRPEENVLMVCKGHSGQGGPNSGFDPCHIEGQGEHGQPCRGVTGS